MRIILADSQRLILAAMKLLFETHAQVRVVATVRNGAQLLEQIAQHKPDAVFADLDLPRINGLELAARLREQPPRIPLLLWARHPRADQVRAALRAGVAGFIDQDADPAELPRALERVQRGQVYLSPSVSYAAITPAGSESAKAPRPLSARQREVLRGLGQGLSTQAIAEQLGVSAKTIETHRMRMMRTLGIRGSHALVRYAICQALASAD